MRKMLMAAILILIAVLCFAASQADIAGGTRDEMEWVLSDSGELTISGQGKMTSFFRFFDRRLAGLSESDYFRFNRKRYYKHRRIRLLQL